ncbi:MAG TPA: twin-arginine translocase TatA/TatE family subunit [Capillimicrobium sp.]|nr:twin-arginine translocase TatA/TatE family subunit [Capillimicrobium sp.]
MFNQIGPLEIAIVLLVVLLIFGPKRLPGLGKSLGTGMREFKDSITGKDSARDEDDEPADRPALTTAPPATPPATTATPAADNETAASAFGQEQRS